MKTLRKLFAITILLCCAGSAFAGDPRFVIHIINAPLVEATGIYSDIVDLNHADYRATKVAAVTDMALLGTQVTFGLLTKFGVGHGNMRRVHLANAIGLVAAGAWLAVQNNIDPGAKKTPARYTSIAHPILCTIPIIMFSF